MSSPSQHSPVVLRVVAPQSHTPSPQPWNPDTQFERSRSFSPLSKTTPSPEPRRITPSPSLLTRKSAALPVITDRGFNLHTTVDRKSKKEQEEEQKKEQENRMKTKEKFETQLQKEGKVIKVKIYEPPPKEKPVDDTPVYVKPPHPKGKLLPPSTKTKIYEHNGVYGPSKFEKGNVWSCCMSSVKDSKGCHVKIVDPLMVDWEEIHSTSPK